MEKIAFYAGSFDPFTVGHFRIVCEALCSYDKVIVGIGENPDKKKHLFGIKDRKELVRQSLQDFLNLWQHRRFCGYAFSVSEEKALARLEADPGCLDIVSYDCLTVDAALYYGATALIRGKRIVGDDADEMYQSIINKQLLAVRRRSLVMDLIPVPQENLTYISSSAFRNLCKLEEYIAAMPYVAPRVHNAMMKKCLKKTFIEAYHETVPGYFDGQPENAWNDLCAAYENRPWHNLTHLAYGINLFNIFCRLSGEHKNIPKEPFLFAWFYHDYVWGEDNAEEKKKKKIIGRLYINQEKDLVAKLIRATVHPPKMSRETVPEKLINDIDMAILGDELNYGRYCLGIRNEYPALNEKAFASGRKSFLQNCLEAEIFHLPFFKEMLEETARHNMQKELQYWQNRSQ